MCAYISLLFIPINFLYVALLCKTKKISGYEKASAFNAKSAYYENVNESLIVVL